MTLAETLPQKLAEWRLPGEGRHSLSQALGDGTWTLHLTADRADSVGCLLWEMSVARTSAAPDAPSLAGWAASAAAAGGLLEPLRVVEVDPLRREALIRSNAPSRRGDQAAYYELLLHDRDRATLRRYRTTAGESGREQVAFALTHEALTRFLEGVVTF